MASGWNLWVWLECIGVCNHHVHVYLYLSPELVYLYHLACFFSIGINDFKQYEVYRNHLQGSYTGILVTLA